MLIDWFTIVAQALNFLILVWLLKRFLYKPILHAIDEREQRIASEFANAKAQMADAQKEHDEFKHKNEEFDRQRVELLTQAMDEVESERQRLLDMARKESEELRTMLKKTIDNERDSLNRNIMTRVQQEVFAIAKKTLADLAGVSLEKRITEVFIRRLREMSEKEREKLTTVLRRSPNPILIRSAFDVPLPQQEAIHSVIHEIREAETKLQFETGNNLLSGIELVADGHKVAWNIMEYIESMEKSIDALISK